MIIQLKLTTLTLLFTIFTTQAQVSSTTFEGEITYANTFKSKNPKVPEKQLRAMLGDLHHVYMRGGDYKTVTNGAFALWQLYIHKDNKIYNKMISSDTVFYNNGMEHYDVVLNSKINTKAITVLGYLCDELILTCQSGVHKYYFNAKFPVDAKLFVKHQYANYYNYISRTNAVPLKMIIEDSEMIIESVATKIEAKKFPADFFTLPPRTITAKSLY